VEFSYVGKGYYLLDSTFIITGRNLKYIIAILNSKVSISWMKTSVATLGEGMYGAKIYVERIPIPPITSQNKLLAEKIESLVNEILSLTQSEDYLSNTQKQSKVKDLEKQIDKLIYKLYDLTDEEIKIVEAN
ncbi:MAG: hypothetical protein ACK4MM_07555, partial [Fervidobacterium sp.]